MARSSILFLSISFPKRSTCFHSCEQQLLIIIACSSLLIFNQAFWLSWPNPFISLIQIKVLVVFKVVFKVQVMSAESQKTVSSSRRSKRLEGFFSSQSSKSRVQNSTIPCKFIVIQVTKGLMYVACVADWWVKKEKVAFLLLFFHQHNNTQHYY